MEMKINDITSDEIGRFIRDVCGPKVPKEAYTNNIGSIVLGMSLVKASENIKEGLVEFTKIMNEKK
jgi:hypothetical protein